MNSSDEKPQLYDPRPRSEIMSSDNYEVPQIVKPAVAVSPIRDEELTRGGRQVKCSIRGCNRRVELMEFPFFSDADEEENKSLSTRGSQLTQWTFAIKEAADETTTASPTITINKDRVEKFLQNIDISTTRMAVALERSADQKEEQRGQGRIRRPRNNFQYDFNKLVDKLESIEPKIDLLVNKSMEPTKSTNVEGDGTRGWN
ncbi:hypothetical protein GCK72_020357 [Caenorhabditis remanei]|uniref:Uncharacterized protein n=1 Tax=Caenorhabditis remanei TaxID=31234 RepID=A0A6A5GFA7_CAERE|nr:hypothetical protein GCK72_020357 [Caenorhabditis remanei]KAF1753800.1 hypothetical protein GCK72_020357 [Caenorhabditis remanei]